MLCSMLYTRRTSTLQESDRIGTGVSQSDSKLGEVMRRRESLGKRAREKGLGKHPVMYEREEETGIPLRDATCFDLQVQPGVYSIIYDNPTRCFLCWTPFALCLL